jgi:predicted transcriptional regulator
MTKDQIDQIFERVRTWPTEQQERAAELVLEEQDREIYVLNDEELAAIKEAEAQAARGEFLSDQDAEALFSRYRNP